MKNNLVIKFVTLLVFSAFILASCSDNKLSIKTDYKSIAYGKLESYRWYDKAQPENNSNITDNVRQFIKDAIDQELTIKELLIQDKGDVDFYVNFSVTTNQRVDIENYNTYSGAAPGYNWNRDTGLQKSIYTEQKTELVYYREGSLVIDIIDPSSDKLIWRGVAKKNLNEELSKGQREKLINQAVSAVLADFPPKTN